MSSTLISILVSIVLALILLVSFFVGRKRGVGRSLLNGGLSIVLLITVFLLTPVITNAILGVSVNAGGTETTLGNFLIEYAKDALGDNATYVTSSESLQTFLTGVVAGVASVLVFIVLGLLSKLIAYIIYIIIEKFGFKSKKQEQEEGLVRNKLGGGLISIVKTFLFMLIIFLPFTSMTQFVEKSFFENYASESAESGEEASIEDTLDSLPSTAEISNNIPSGVKRAISGYNKSLLGLTGNLFGIGDVSFDYLSNIDVKGEKISIRQTAVQLLDFYDYIVDTYADYKEDKTDFFKNLDYTKFDKYKETFLNDGMFKGFVLNLVIDYVENYEDVFPADFVEDNRVLLEGIANKLAEEVKPTDYLLEDVSEIFDLVESAGKSGFLDDYLAMEEKTTKNIALLIADKYSSTFAGDVVTAVFSMNLVRDNFENVFDKIENSLGDGDVEVAIKKSKGSIQNWDQFIFDTKALVAKLGNLYNHVEVVGIEPDSLVDDLYLILKANPTSVGDVLMDIGNLLDGLDELEIMKDSNGNKILNDVLDAVGFGDLLKDVTAPEGKKVNYSYLMEKLTPAVKTIIEFDLYTEIKDGNYVDAICKIGDSIYQDSIISHEEGYVTKQTKLEDVFKTIYDLPRVKELTVDAFKDELSAFVDISYLDDATLRDGELRNLTNIIIQLSCNKITVETEQISFLRFLLKDGNDFEGLIDAIEEDKVDALLSPILLSKMTDTVRATIFDTIRDEIVSLTSDSTITLDATWDKINCQVSQIDEICKIFKNFLKVYKEDVTDIASVNKTNIGLLLDSLKENAYRGDLNSKIDAYGIFKDVFDKVVTKAETDYDISFTKAMNKTHNYEVQFTHLFSFVETLENDTSSFKTAIKNAMDGGEVTEDEVKAIFDSISSENYEAVIATLDKARANEISVGVGDVTVDGKGVSEAIDAYNFEESSKGLSTEQISTIRNKLKDVLN